MDLEPKDWISLGSAVIAVIFGVASIIGAVFSKRIVMGQQETSLRAAIRLTRQAVQDLAIRIGTVMDGKREDEVRAEDRRRLQPLALAFREAIEDNLNAYEDACAKYLDKKIDRGRFFKSYSKEIENICTQENNEIAKFMHPADTSSYQAIWKVYREWFVREK
jgi:hypothetical protein